MKKIFFSALVLCFTTMSLHAQSTVSTSSNKEISVDSEAFLNYVNENALTIFTPKKAGFPVTGTINKKEVLTLKAYNLKALEDKVQYFSLEGTNEILKVESLYRLRIMYSTQNNTK